MTYALKWSVRRLLIGQQEVAENSDVTSPLAPYVETPPTTDKQRVLQEVGMPWTSGGTSRTGTAAHKRWRTAVMRRDNNTCQERRSGCLRVAAHADHIIPVAEGGAEYDPANGQAICVPCHRAKTQEEAMRGRARRSRWRPERRHP